MLIKLLPNQIPMLWNQIKFAAVNADRINEKDRESYLVRLLYSLLGNKAQCFIRLDESRILQAVIITRLMVDEMTGDNSLLVQCLYSFQGVPDSAWSDDLDAIKIFALKNRCKKIISYSNNKRVFDLANQLGFEERFRCFVKYMED